MPTLAAHVGLNQISFLIIDDSDNYDTFQFPYVYNPSLFDFYTTGQKFYSDVIKYVLKKYGLSLENTNVVVTGYLKPIPLDFDVKVSTTTTELLTKVSVRDTVILLGDLGYFGWSSSLKNEIKEYVSNKSIHTSMISSDRGVLSYLSVQNLQSRQVLSAENEDSLGIVFSGSTICEQNRKKPYVYSLVLNALNELGLFETSVDRQNILFPLMSLALVDKRLYNRISKRVDFVKLGTVFRDQESVECLVESEVGTSQFVEVPKGTVFFLPVEEGAKTRIYLKSSTFGEREGYVSGGDLGFVIDTRGGIDHIISSLQTDAGIYLEEGPVQSMEKEIREVFDRL